jgi:hypothetical protein
LPAMRIVLALAITLIACTKQNPNLCCVDEADCANVGLEETRGCDDGLLCRGNQCIAEVCASSAECDADAPYCVFVPDGRCQPACTEDAQCPGFGDAVERTFCEAGGCVACRAGMADCSGATPVCGAQGLCVGCSRNDQCASGVCVDDGTCADESEIGYVSPTGLTTNDCSATMPCKAVENALAIAPNRPFIVIESGTYTTSASIQLRGVRRLIGRGPTPPLLRRSTNGPIITLGSGGAAATIGLEFLDIGGAVGGGLEDDTGGHGIVCPIDGNATLSLVESVVRQNQSSGVRIRRCTLKATRSQFKQNGVAIASTDSDVDVDASQFTLNTNVLNLDAGSYQITNNFITRNLGTGIELFLFSSETAKIEFNTIVDNGVGFSCNTIALAMPNNIIARNATETAGNCTFPNSVMVDSDISPIKFVSPDVTPFDYHIQSGSIAIDAAVRTVDQDFDGDVRSGDTADIGADELAP